MENRPDDTGTDMDYERGGKIFRRAFSAFFTIFVVGIAFWIGYERGQSGPAAGGGSIPIDEAIFINKQSGEKTLDFSLFWKVWALLKEKHIDAGSFDANTLFYGAIKGMLAATGDPYTAFFDPEENRDFNEDMAGTFEGIGAEMGIKDGILTIIAPLEGMPAEKAGLMAGDKVLKIDGEDSADFSIEEAVSKIRGTRGTEVTLTIYRKDEETAREMAVKRDTIFVKSVRYEMKENGIAYVRINRFGEETENEFRDIAKRVSASGAEGMILDLRNNPGGYLDGAVSIGSFMLPFGKPIVLEESGSAHRRELKSRGGDILSPLPTAVLINEGSASASEILAGALRESRSDVILVGKTSFGKGSVQELIPVGKDTSVKITVAHWLTPSGTQINGIGIKPDIEAELTAEDAGNGRDPQLEKAISALLDRRS